jgi:hypothetical protein
MRKPWGRWPARGIAALALGAAVLVPAPTTASTRLILAKTCRKTFTVQGRTYARKRLALIVGCVEEFLKCDLQREIDAVDPTLCRASATSACVGRIGPSESTALARAAERFDAKTGTACQTAEFSYADVVSTEAGGLWFGTDVACASAVDLPAFLVCLRDRIDAGTDALASTLQPRVALLFDNAGLGAGFPHLARPPFVDQIVSATTPVSGTLVDPGTIVVAAGSALRFTADASTLPCSGSTTNGRVTITVGTGATAEVHVLAEPYASGGVAIFGPWTTAGTIPYSIERKDGACQDVVSGSVSVP